MKVSQLLNEWLLSIQPTVKESTYAKYSFLVQKHINSELGDILLSNLTTEDISCFTAGKLNGGNLSDGSALSPKTVADLLSILKLALTFAAERNYPCPNHIIIKKPRQTRKYRFFLWRSRKSWSNISLPILNLPVSESFSVYTRGFALVKSALLSGVILISKTIFYISGARLCASRTKLTVRHIKQRFLLTVQRQNALSAAFLFLHFLLIFLLLIRGKIPTTF